MSRRVVLKPAGSDRPGTVSGVTEPRREITLKDAVLTFKNEREAPVNAYDCYRKDASRFGKVFIGGELPVHRRGARWFARWDDLERSIASHRARLQRRRELTDDYRAHRLHGNKGETTHTDFGGHHFWEPFHFVWSDYEVGRHKSDGSLRCNRCWSYVRVTEGGAGICEGCGLSAKVGRWRS